MESGNMRIPPAQGSRVSPSCLDEAEGVILQQQCLHATADLLQPGLVLAHAVQVLLDYPAVAVAVALGRAPQLGDEAVHFGLQLLPQRAQTLLRVLRELLHGGMGGGWMDG